MTYHAPSDTIMFRLPYLCRLPSKLRRKARRSRMITMFIALAVVLIFLTPFYIIYKPPTSLIRKFMRRWPDVLWHVNTSEKIIALTIDDAPSPYSQQIMDILKENDVHATFFVIGGQVPGRENVLKEMVKRGHELGNHAMHDEPSVKLPDSELIHQMDTVDGMLNAAYKAAGSDTHPPHYFRPGSGFFSKRMRERMDMLQYRTVLGDIYPHDPQIPYWRINAAHILSMLKPGGIIICHDRRSWTVPMLRKVIPEIKRRGYQITTVSGLVKEAPKERRKTP
ncbi:glycoside hydrolase/deacetylase [Byssothecium circinans]|uniref:chitin deacetylase n=1 Tax=Byssothecium circinans TaxID=147558 RepID=A0A6A5TV59_9PLEO|nr:glycoside hydrolase/deacetylase [Byssothecium circinans]